MEFDPGIDVVLMTAHYTTESAVEAIKKGRLGLSQQAGFRSAHPANVSASSSPTFCGANGA